VYSNKNSDLALLKIEDEDYKQAKALPFTIRKKSSDLGEDIFTLGFPRNDNDIVYGRGYLSAQTGFNGDSNTYQIQISATDDYRKIFETYSIAMIQELISKDSKNKLIGVSIALKRGFYILKLWNIDAKEYNRIEDIHNYAKATSSILYEPNISKSW
jgi:hypothetical protein